MACGATSRAHDPNPLTLWHDEPAHIVNNPQGKSPNWVQGAQRSSEALSAPWSELAGTARPPGLPTWCVLAQAAKAKLGTAPPQSHGSSSVKTTLPMHAISSHSGRIYVG